MTRRLINTGYDVTVWKPDCHQSGRTGRGGAKRWLRPDRSAFCSAPASWSSTWQGAAVRNVHLDKLVSREILIEESHDVWRHLQVHLSTIDTLRIVT